GPLGDGGDRAEALAAVSDRRAGLGCGPAHEVGAPGSAGIGALDGGAVHADRGPVIRARRLLSLADLRLGRGERARAGGRPGGGRKAGDGARGTRGVEHRRERGRRRRRGRGGREGRGGGTDLLDHGLEVGDPAENVEVAHPVRVIARSQLQFIANAQVLSAPGDYPVYGYPTLAVPS